MLPKFTYRFNAIPIKILTVLCRHKLILKSIHKFKRCRITLTPLEKQSEMIHITRLKTYNKPIAIKTVWKWHKDKQINETE